MAAGFCPKNLAFARKTMALAKWGGLQPVQIKLLHTTDIDSATVVRYIKGSR